MGNTNSIKGEQQKTLRILIIVALSVCIIVETVLSYTLQGMIFSLPFPIILILSGVFVALWMLYLYLNENLALLRYPMAIFIILLIIAGILLPFSNLPPYVSIYLGIYGTLILLLYYYLSKKLRIKYKKEST